MDVLEDAELTSLHLGGWAVVTRRNDDRQARLDRAEVEAYLEFDPETFRGKVVYCNCDDPFESNFFKYFAANFNKLEVAWRFKTDNLGTRPEFKLEGTPLAIRGVLYTTAGTGELLWVHAELEGERGMYAPRQLSGRGVSYWTDGKGDERILYVTTGFRLIALNATAKIASAAGERTVSMEEFFRGPGQNVMSTDEILTEITIPKTGPQMVGEYIKFSPRDMMDLAYIGVAVAYNFASDKKCSGVRIVLGAVAPTPLAKIGMRVHGLAPSTTMASTRDSHSGTRSPTKRDT